MNIIINQVYLSTIIFISIFLIALLVSIKKKGAFDMLSISVSQELKGFAILGVIFCHIRYFLVSDNHFLFPLSIVAGICVDLFLFLSGYGLVTSAIKKGVSTLDFYKKNLLKLYTTFWISTIILFLMSFFVAHISYSTSYIFKTLAGIFTTADIYKDINSPLWYFSFIIFYYLLFPIVFSRKYPWVSAITIFLITLIISIISPSFMDSINNLHYVHILAFPLGMIGAYLLSKENIIEAVKTKIAGLNKITYYLLSLILVIIFYLSAYKFSGVGHGVWQEQIVNMIAVFSLIVLFSIKKINFGLLSLFGLYSYEIYLIHWPIMYHYDIFYKYTPAWLATTLYLILFVGFGFLLKKVSAKII